MCMEEKLARYYELKAVKKQIDEELDSLRQQLLVEFPEPTKLAVGEYQVKVTFQEKREFDDSKLYNALPDPSIWRLLSKVDSSKVSSLLKLNIITEDLLANTYEIKKVPYVQVQKL